MINPTRRPELFFDIPDGKFTESMVQLRICAVNMGLEVYPKELVTDDLLAEYNHYIEGQEGNTNQLVLFEKRFDVVDLLQQHEQTIIDKTGRYVDYGTMNGAIDVAAVFFWEGKMFAVKMNRCAITWERILSNMQGSIHECIICLETNFRVLHRCRICGKGTCQPCVDKLVVDKCSACTAVLNRKPREIDIYIDKLRQLEAVDLIRF